MPTDTFDYTPLHADFHGLGKPAQRALITAGLTDHATIAARTERELLALHGMGPKSIPSIRAILQATNLDLASG